MYLIGQRDMTKAPPTPHGSRGCCRAGVRSGGATHTGERVKCGGVMSATLGDRMPDLVCSEDRTHRIPPDVWSRNYWKRAHTMTPKVVG
jgi:hypothetical protein